MGILNIFIFSNSRPGDPVKVNGRKDAEFNPGRMKITSVGNFLKVLLIKMGKRKTIKSRKEIAALSSYANVRCLDCGWKYNVNSTTQCPICTSERTYLLSNGTFFASALTIALIVITFCGILILAYRSITS
jgi:ribosomal protein S27E